MLLLDHTVTNRPLTTLGLGKNTLTHANVKRSNLNKLVIHDVLQSFF